MRFNLLLALVLVGFSITCFGAWIEVSSPIAHQVPTVDVRGAADHRWQIDISIPGFAVEASFRNGEAYDRISLPMEMMAGSDGEAELPIISRLIALRSTGDPEIEVVAEEWMELEGTYNLALDTERAGATELAAAYIMRDKYLPEVSFNITPRQIMGGVSLAVVHIRAAKYNPVQKKIKVLKSAEIVVHESGSALSYERPITETTAAILRAVVPNWDLMNLDVVVVRGTLLYVVPNNSTVPEELKDLVTWRTHKGYTVEIAGPSEIGTLNTTSIKNYIGGMYNAADPPLEFVCLVGDAGGPYNIPTYYRNGGVGDWNYSRLDGNDLLPDVAIGRYCFDTINALRVIVNKTYYYERDPAPPAGGSNPNWYKGGGCFVGRGSGISTVHTLRWVRERMVDANYTSSSIDTVYYVNENVYDSKITSSINSGVSLWCYRGFYHMESYDEYDINQLNNGRRLPFITTITCSTNDFDYDTGLSAVCENLLKAGTTSNPKGVIAIIGTSSLNTHTRYNNCLVGGVIQGLLREDIHTVGGCLNRSKLELYINYPTDMSGVEAFCHYESLLGDPAVDVFTDTPESLFVDNPSSIPVGMNTLTLTVTNEYGQPVADAYVNLVKGSEIFLGDRTNTDGQVVFNFNATTAETLFVTATKHNSRPAINYTIVSERRCFVSPSSLAFTIDDDRSGESHGDGDGLANPGETIEIAVPLKNWGTARARGVIGILSSSDPFVVSIGDAHENYSDIGAGKRVLPYDDFDFTLADYIPDGHALQFNLTVADIIYDWVSAVPITVSNGNFEYLRDSLSGVGDGILDPVESGYMIFWFENVGTRGTQEGTITYLRSGNPAVTIPDSIGTFAASTPGGLCHNQADPFGIRASNEAFPGECIPLTCIIPLANGFADTVYTNLYIGSIASNAPTPPDAHGYWAFDNTDVTYDQHPTYNWIEIDPRGGGAGTLLNIVDTADEEDMTIVVDLPFFFKYYGKVFNAISVCSNGWIAMGADQAIHTTFRNWHIPGALGPSAMIAPFWDDLLVGVESVSQNPEPEVDKPERLSAGASPTGHLDDCVPDFQISIDCSGYTSPIRTICGAGDDCETRGAEDHIYEIEILESGTYAFTMCNSPGGPQAWDSYMYLDGECCAANHISWDDDGCGSGGLSLIQHAHLSRGTYYLLIEGYYPYSCGEYQLEIGCQLSGAICAYHDAANHRYIVEWSCVRKVNGSSNPTQTFECILYEPGHPETPTGDGEILFQYMTCNNTYDVYTSNHFATVGIENLDETDGVLYSYYNRTSPEIP